MARPCKQRYVSPPFRERTFTTRGVSTRRGDSPVSRLSLDELEAIRLADLDGDQQDEAAAKMNVSRATFGRILLKARRTVTEALVHGHTLQIGGGHIRITRRGGVRCDRCRCAWEVPLDVAAEFRCPRCPKEEGSHDHPPG
jgi:predicted DNA-binding protein (UPF0251 family)